MSKKESVCEECDGHKLLMVDDEMEASHDMNKYTKRHNVWARHQRITGKAFTFFEGSEKYYVYNFKTHEEKVLDLPDTIDNEETTVTLCDICQKITDNIKKEIEEV